MESQWTSKYAILRDLSFAQGRKVPAAILGSVGAGQKPPKVITKEDTEEEFYENCAGDGGIHTKPDLSLIKKMLNIVRECDPLDDGDTDKIVEISKIYPLNEQLIPKGDGICDEKKETMMTITNGQSSIDITAKTNHVITQPEVKKPKKRRERNAALISLLEKEQSLLTHVPSTESISTSMVQTFEKIPEETINTQSLEIRLLKPNDFIIDSNIPESVEKVNEWLQKPVKTEEEKTKPISISPKNMFRKKMPAALSENTYMFKRKSDTSSIKSSDSDTVVRQADNVFVPSTHANEYYQKFVERHQIQQTTQEDIWRRAERLMKEIDAKRRMEKEKKAAEVLDNTGVSNELLEENNNSTKNEQRPSSPLNVPGLEIPSIRLSILLPQHRHDLPEECKVCLAFAKFKQQNASS